MPITLDRSGYLEIMEQKGVAREESAKHYQRIDKMLQELDPSGQEPVFGCVDVGTSCYWWDYGQVSCYILAAEFLHDSI